MKFKLPLIVVKDIEISRKFYEEILNQKVILNFGANITFEGEFSLQTKETWAGFIDREEKYIISKPDNFELYFEEEELDTFVEKLKDYNIKYIHNVKEYPWGQRVIRFYDPDMHIIEVGESMETVIRRFISQGMSVEETAEITQHPVEYIKNCI